MSFIRALLGVVIAAVAMTVTIVVGAVSALVAACVTGFMMICGIILVIATAIWLLLSSLFNALTGKSDPPT